MTQKLDEFINQLEDSENKQLLLDEIKVIKELI
jgi:hypothetical protein